MSEADNRRAVERLLEGINARNVGVMDEVMTEDCVMSYPQSGEIIRGAANRRAVYAATPSLPTITTYRTISSGDIVVTEAVLDYGGDRFNTVFVFECRDGRIARETVYWSKPFPPAASRAPWVDIEPPGK
jgi:ketosteroid isomerase-like protein